MKHNANIIRRIPLQYEQFHLSMSKRYGLATFAPGRNSIHIIKQFYMMNAWRLKTVIKSIEMRNYIPCIPLILIHALSFHMASLKSVSNRLIN